MANGDTMETFVEEKDARNGVRIDLDEKVFLNSDSESENGAKDESPYERYKNTSNFAV